MLTLPEIAERNAQAYAYIKFTVSMHEMQRPADEGFPALFDYLKANQIAPIGAAFYNYRRIDMSDTLDVEAGIAVATVGQGDGHITFGTLPAGRFVELTWIGHPDQLMSVTAMLIGWTNQMQIELDVKELADGDHFACRLEVYESDPDNEPDMDKWVTHLAFKVKD